MRKLTVHDPVSEEDHSGEGRVGAPREGYR